MKMLILKQNQRTQQKKNEEKMQFENNFVCQQNRKIKKKLEMK